jgi:UV DNA damage endonuclease
MPPRLGLVCLTEGERIRFRTITKTRLDALEPRAADDALRAIYVHNARVLDDALSFCSENGIALYRMVSGLFPFADMPIGTRMLRRFGSSLRKIGARAARLGIRVVSHPDQFIVLSSESERVVANSKVALAGEARVFDALGLPRSAWSTMTIHGGKGGRADALVAELRALPPEIRTRIAIENDEYAYHAEEALAVARAAGVPMVFDAHHHLVAEKLAGYDDPSVAHYLALARETWPDPAWQLTHVSNGRTALCDAKHSDLIGAMPAAFADAPWIEVEAKRKEAAILDLRARGTYA